MCISTGAQDGLQTKARQIRARQAWCILTPLRATPTIPDPALCQNYKRGKPWKISFNVIYEFQHCLSMKRMTRREPRRRKTPRPATRDSPATLLIYHAMWRRQVVTRVVVVFVDAGCPSQTSAEYLGSNRIGHTSCRQRRARCYCCSPIYRISQRTLAEQPERLPLYQNHQTVRGKKDQKTELTRCDQMSVRYQFQADFDCCCLL